MRGRPMVWIALVAAIFSAAYSFWRVENLPAESVSGRVTAVIRERSEERLLLQSVLIEAGGEKTFLDGNVLLYEDPCGCELLPGMRVTLETTLEPLRPPVGPHGWDDRMWFIQKGAVYTCEGALLSHSASAPFSLRHAAQTVFHAHIGALWEEDAPLITALLLGLDEELNEAAMEDFRRSGTAHLMAVSGLHVGFVAALATGCFCFLRKNGAAQIALLLLSMGGYALLAQSAFSVFRACMMLAAGLCARHCGRRPDSMTALALAVTAALIADPMEILRAGFLLSVCAVLGILLLADRIEKPLRRAIRWRYLSGAIAVSLSAQLGVLPVQVYLFGTVNALSLLTNLFAVPLAAGVVMLGLPTVLLHMVLPPAALLLAPLVQWMAKGLAHVSGSVAGLGAAQYVVSSPPVFVLLCFVGILFLFSRYFAEYGRRGRIILASAVLGAAALGLGLWVPRALEERNTPQVVFLSVGTADSALFQSAEGSLLVDTGWSGSQAADMLAGEAIALDAVLLTHSDQDHAGGLGKVLATVPVGAVMTPKGMDWEGLKRERATAEALGIPVVELTAGDAMTVGAFRVEVLSPAIVRKGEENEDSLVLRVTCQDTALLLLGDVTQRVEETLPLSDCDILKVAHHGSATATSARLLEKTAPEHAVISVGTRDRYGFPRAEVLERLRDANARIWRTDEDNAVIVRIAQKGYSIAGYEQPTLLQEWFGVP